MNETIKSAVARLRAETSGSAEATSYLTHLTRQRLLTFEEELDLAARVRAGDAAAKERLIEANMRLVINVARHYHSSHIPFEDLVQEGAIGLMRAVEGYDASRGYRFSTYATHWIRQAISRAIDNKSKAIRLPAHVSDALRRIERCRAELARENDEEPTLEQIAQGVGMSLRKLNALLLAGLEPVSLDVLVGAEEDTPLGALINDCKSPNPQDEVLSAEMREEIRGLFAALTPRERAVIRKRLGFEDEATQVLQEIGDTMHISRERVRQIENQAIKKLRYAAKQRNLRGYMTS